MIASINRPDVVAQACGQLGCTQEGFRDAVFQAVGLSEDSRQKSLLMLMAALPALQDSGVFDSIAQHCLADKFITFDSALVKEAATQVLVKQIKCVEAFVPRRDGEPPKGGRGYF